MADIDTLRILAGKATRGPWKHFLRAGVNEVQCREKTPIVAWAGFDDSTRSARKHAANAAYIAACDPQTILALLDENERLRKALEPFARLDMPAAEKWTCGTFLIEHSDIRAARAALSEV